MLMCMIITGLVCGFLLKSGFGFFIGLFLGVFVYKFLNQAAPIQSQQKNEKKDLLFLELLFEAIGAVCKAKGRVTKEDIAFVSAKMDERQFTPERRKLAQDAFNRGKSPDYRLDQRINELYSSFKSQPNVLNFFCEQLILTAMHDGDFCQNELNVILNITDRLHLSRQQVIRYIDLMKMRYSNSYSNHSSYQQSRSNQNYSNQGYSRQQDSSYRQGSSYQSSKQNELANAYQTLGVKSTDDVQTIKRAYRKLMNEYHPDKLASKGLPKEMRQAANVRAQEIRSAYDLIKVERKF